MESSLYIAGGSEDFHQLDLTPILYAWFNPSEKVIDDSVRLERRSSCESSPIFSLISRFLSNQSLFNVDSHMQRMQHGL